MLILYGICVIINTLGDVEEPFFNNSVKVLAFDFVGSAGSFGVSFPPQRPMTSDFEGFSVPDCIHYIYFPILILEKEPVFSLLNVQC